MHVLGPVRNLALGGGVTGQEVSQNDILLGPAEQPGTRDTAARSGLAENAEAERLMGTGERLGRGPTDPCGEAFAQVGRCGSRGGEHEGLVGCDPVTVDPFDHQLDGRSGLASARSTQDAHHRSGPALITVRGPGASELCDISSVTDDGSLSTI
jgi:hypothetical protein